MLAACSLLALLVTPAPLSIKVDSRAPVAIPGEPAWDGPIDMAGNTSVTNNSKLDLKHSSTGKNCGYFAVPGNKDSERAYLQRNRDLGQTFRYIGTKAANLRSLTLRTGFGSNVVAHGMWGQKVSLQFFRVKGGTALNNNGTEKHATHGWPHCPPEAINAERDDYLEGETFEPLAFVRPGVFPKPAAFACTSAMPASDDACLKGKYLTFKLPPDQIITFEPDADYAFLVMILGEGNNRSFTLANAFVGKYQWGHAIRREGNGVMPPSPVNLAKPLLHIDNEKAIKSARFLPLLQRLRMLPGTNGYPDVDTHRDLEFIVQLQR